MKAVYFAWVREHVGKSEEDIHPPASVRTVADLVAWLSARDEAYARAFEAPLAVRAALDRVHVKPEALLGSAREIAFFPPMTGG